MDRFGVAWSRFAVEEQRDGRKGNGLEGQCKEERQQGIDLKRKGNDERGDDWPGHGLEL